MDNTILLLGEHLRERCPNNDCMRYLAVYRLWTSVDKQIGSAEGYHKTSLKREANELHYKMQSMIRSSTDVRRELRGLLNDD